MKSITLKESPFKTLISFHKLIESLEEIAQSDVDYRSNYAKALLKEIEAFPEFRDGIEDLSLIENNEALVRNLLADLFPTALTHNEIKAVAIPFQNLTFNYTERFKKILQHQGFSPEFSIRDVDDDQLYIMNCALILNEFYGQKINFNKPLFFDIQDQNGIMNHYRILYNADFVEIIPTEKSLTLTQEEVHELLDNYDNIDLWKAKFPKESWILKGFGIVSLYDATTESAISNLKSNLLKSEIEKAEYVDEFETIFRSVFRIPELRVGFILYNQEENTFVKPPYSDETLSSYLLFNEQELSCSDSLFSCCFEEAIAEKKSLIIADVDQYLLQTENKALCEHLLSQGIKSAVFSPVIKNNVLLGVIELVAPTARVLNSLNAEKLDLIIPYLVDTIERHNTDILHQVEAVIQREYTAIHPSVYWKFRKEAYKYIQTNSFNKEYIFKEIVFKEVFPLYGQIDIKGSSVHRNEVVKEDLKNQLKTLLDIFTNQKSNQHLLLLEQRQFELQSFYNELDAPLKADSEQLIQNYIENEIHPILRNTKMDFDTEKVENSYFASLDPKTGLFYYARKKFDNAMSIINKKLAAVLDKKQVEAQQIYPHYYERFKTDGVEHNLYIGTSIAPTRSFDMMYLHNLRLWQLQTLCEMELAHHQLKATLPYELDVTSLILVFSSPLSIRFRMDEKRFDVDGTYNARYEVVKKRIDKAHSKGTQERITQKEKITIVYSHNNEEQEYLKYIKYLQFKNILEPTVEQFEIEDLQGVSGLRALRVKVKNTTESDTPTKTYTYQELLDEIK